MVKNRKKLSKKHTAPTGYTDWCGNDEIVLLTQETTKSNLNICMNQALIAFNTINKIYSRIPEGSQTYDGLAKIGQELYNLLGNITTAVDFYPHQTPKVQEED